MNTGRGLGEDFSLMLAGENTFKTHRFCEHASEARGPGSSWGGMVCWGTSPLDVGKFMNRLTSVT